MVTSMQRKRSEKYGEKEDWGETNDKISRTLLSRTDFTSKRPTRPLQVIFVLEKQGMDKVTRSDRNGRDRYGVFSQGTFQSHNVAP